MESQLILRVLSGQHRGAELPLPPGKYVLGSSDEADIIISDPGIAPEHLTIEIGEEDAIHIIPQGTVSAFFEDSNLNGPFDVALYQPLGIGQAVIAFGVEGEEWPELEFETGGTPKKAVPCEEENMEGKGPQEEGEKGDRETRL